MFSSLWAVFRLIDGRFYMFSTLRVLFLLEDMIYPIFNTLCVFFSLEDMIYPNLRWFWVLFSLRHVISKIFKVLRTVFSLEDVIYLPCLVFFCWERWIVFLGRWNFSYVFIHGPFSKKIPIHVFHVGSVYCRRVFLWNL